MILPACEADPGCERHEEVEIIDHEGGKMTFTHTYKGQFGHP